VVLSGEEVSRLIAAAPNAKYQAALSVAYGAGLRAAEVVALKVTDVDGERMTLRVERGKGSKDRYAMLSPVLLERLRAWWRVGHAQGKMLPGGWLFPGHDVWIRRRAWHADPRGLQGRDRDRQQALNGRRLRRVWTTNRSTWKRR